MLIISHASSGYKHASGGFQNTVISAISVRRHGLVRRRLRAVFPALLCVLLSLSARAGEAQQAQWPKSIATDTTAVSLGFLRISKVFPFDLRPTPATDTYFLSVPFTSWVSNWQNRLRSTLEQERYAFLRPAWANAPANRELAVIDIPVNAPNAPTTAAPDTAGRPSGILSGKIGQYAEIGMSVQGRGEMGGSWNRYKPCDPGIQLTCTPSLFPQLRPDMQFGIRVAGTISERIHVDVDYDQRREFDAANNINVYYQGMEDEVLQRVEVGDVSIRLPASRYLTQGIPTGNFGFKATGQLGPLEFQTIFAQQRGDVSTRQFQLGGLGSAQGLVQDAELVRDDADYVKGQFFFLVDPDSLRGAPYVDVLALQAGDAPASLRPASGGNIQVFRDERISLTNPQQQAQLRYFRADGVNGSVRQAGLFRQLIPEENYIVHPSGLWIMLRSPLRADESLAISYITERGDTIGTMDPERLGSAAAPVLKLLRGPTSTHQPNQPTWNYELHQVYLIDNSNNVDLNSVNLRISLGDITGGQTFRNVRGQNVSLLRFFGLDEDSPVDQVDVAQIYQPGRDPFGIGTGAATPRAVTGTYVIFSALRPFQKPGPIQSVRLSATEVQAELGIDRNDVIYDTSDPQTRESGGKFRLNFKFRQKVEGVLSSFSLGAFGIRENSERLYFGDKVLTAGTDYTIDYDLGQVTLNDAASLFATDPSAQIRATWEQKSLFQIAPTSVFGLNARYGLGRRGEINFVSLYQAEKSIMSRPQIGAEPGSILLGGASARLDLGGYFLDRALSKFPGLHVSLPSAVTLSGELALSAPNPNTRGAAFLDDFEATEETQIATSRRFWRLGSRPESNEFAISELPTPLDATTAAQLVWQHDPTNPTSGQSAGLFRPQEIDRLISVAGSELPETVLWLTFGDTVPNTIGKRWRSMTTVLSTTGRDMSRSEYLEFYLWSTPVRGQTMVFDIGAVSEDAFYYDANRLTNGTYPDGQKWGLGEFDQEARLAQGDIFAPDKDARGLWNAPCEGNRQQQYPLGSPNANCAKNNGEPDTEDLNGDGILESNDGAYFRFVVPVDDQSPYLVRDNAATGTNFRLFRVPLRTAGKPVNGASDATWRFVKHLRMTLVSTPVGPARQNFVIARPRIIGARWTKRDVFGISSGMLSDKPSPTAGADNLEVGPVSRLADAAYASPAGITNELQDPSQRFGSAGVEFNEKSLRLKYNHLAPDERAEVYFRYPQQSRAFLNYRALRLWVLARQGTWGPTGAMQFLVKIGNDPRNYYLFRSKLTPPHTGTIVPSDWLPEITIDFQQWMNLRVQAEQIANTVTPTPGQPITVWSADSTYAVVMEDRARAPNLSAMREMSFAIYNSGSGLADGEIWIDDMRVTEAFREAGAAGSVSLDIRGGDFFNTNITYANQGSVFRQLNQDPRYEQTGDLSISTTAQLGLMLPSAWGVDLPVSVVHTNANLTPTFLAGTDIRAQELNGLRTTGANATRVSASLRKRTPAANPFVGLLVDGLQLRFGYNTAENNSVTASNDASGIDAGAVYARDLKPRTFTAMPGLLQSALRALAPARVEQSDFFKRLTGARFRWSPERFSVGTAYFDQERRAFQFSNILALPTDSLPTPIESPRKGLENDAFITFQPFNALRATLSMRSSRDLLETERASRDTLQRSAINEARRRFGGFDVGWESNRSLGTELSWRPDVSPWLRPTFTYNGRYGSDRNTSYLDINESDSTALMQRRFQADRSLMRGLLLEPNGFVNALLGLPAQGADSLVGRLGGFSRLARRGLMAVQPIELNWNNTLGSQFERERDVPGLGYQFGLGNFEAYRLIGGDTAVFVNERDVFSARSGIALPFTTVVTASYDETTLDAIDQRGGHRSQLDRTWPNVQVSVPRLPLPGFLSGIVTNSALNVGYQRTKQESLLGGLGSQDRTGLETRIPFSVTLGFQRGFSARYAASFGNGESTDPTGNAENASNTHDVSVSGFIQVPESLKPKLQQPIQVTLAFHQQGQSQCRFRDILSGATTATECVPFIDFRNRSLNLVMESRVSDLTIGFNMAYTSRQSFVGTRSGNSQFQLGFSGQFNLKAGRDLGGDGVR